jgi:purine-binding chemotaxis protein CheW
VSERDPKAPGRGGGLPSSGLAAEVLPRLRAKLAEKRSRRDVKRDTAPVSSLLGFADEVQAAVAAPDERPPSPTRQLVSFWVCGAEYALPIACVQEIFRAGEISRVPQAPEHIRGVTNVRGRVIPVVEVSTRLGGDPVTITPESCIVAVIHEGRVLGLLVERASRVITLEEEAIEPPPREVLGRGADYVVGVGKQDHRVILLLELERLLRPPGS